MDPFRIGDRRLDRFESGPGCRNRFCRVVPVRGMRGRDSFFGDGALCLRTVPPRHINHGSDGGKQDVFFLHDQNIPEPH